MDDEQNQENIVSGVGFNEPRSLAGRAGRTPKMVLFVKNNSFGLIRNSKQATLVLWVLVILALGVSLFLTFDSKPPAPYTPRSATFTK